MVNGDGWSSLADFHGVFEGNNHTIALPTPFFNTLHATAIVGELGILGSTLANTNEGLIRYSYATGSVTGSSSNTGGLVDLNRGTIIHSHATGNIAGQNVGGLVGSNEGEIAHSYATGNATASNDVGGLVGLNSGNISHSYALGDRDGGPNGGLVGTNHGIITSSYASGDTITSGRAFFSGGLVGANQNIINNSYASGDSGGFYSGGLVGLNNGVIRHSYAAGTGMGIYGDFYSGGLSGYVYDSGHVIESYRVQSTGFMTVGRHRTLAQLGCPTMANASCQGGNNTYAGWDDAIWDFGDNASLPVPRHLPACPSSRPHCRH